MIVVSNKDFATNQEKYFDMAINERVFVQRGSYMFHLACTNDNNAAVKERVYYEPDEDFYISMTKDELLKGIHDDIDKFFASK